LLDNQDWQQEQQGELKTRFLDGKLYNQDSLEQIRQRIACPSPQPAPCTDRGHGRQVFKDMVNTF